MFNLPYTRTGTIELVLQQMGNPILFYISATSLCMGCFIIVKSVMTESTLGEFFGINSMIIMTFHFPIIFWLRKAFQLDDFSIFVMTCVVLYILVLAVNKYIPWSFNFKLLHNKNK